MRIFVTKAAMKIPSYKLYDHTDFGYFFRTIDTFTGPLAIDLETSGLDPFSPDAYIRSVSLASNTRHCVAIDMKQMPDKAKARFWEWATNYKPGFIAHNSVFESSWCQLHGRPIKIHRCTAAMFRNMSNEGYAGQNWQLKTAMTEVLGWPSTNKGALKQWLIEHKLSDGDMHQAPWYLLGPYNALDSGATYQLYTHINTLLAASPFNEVMQGYWDIDISTMIDLISTQYVHGIHVNTPMLKAAYSEMTEDMLKFYDEFVNQEPVKLAIAEYNEEFIKRESITNHKEFTATGKPSTNWIRYQARMAELVGKNHFNVDSNAQLQWLFFNKLKIPPIRFVEKKQGGRRVKTDNPSVDKKALPLLGKTTRPLINYRKVRDTRKFATTILNVSVNDVVHPFLTVAGTVTGRQSGGLRDAEGTNDKKFNIQNIANDKRLFNPLIAPKGYKIIYLDFNSLEPHVLCEFSKDPKLRELYLNGSCHDLYLWYGGATEVFGDTIRAIYPMDNPSPESVGKAKKELKDLRKALKIIVLGLGYNMGEVKLMNDVNDQTDFVLTLKDARRLKKEYFRFFPGITFFMEKIDQVFIHYDEKYIINGRGRPMFSLMDKDSRGKLVNKFVQSTGHDCLQLYVHMIKSRRDALSFEMIPYHVDLHDATAFIFKDTPENEAIATKIYLDSLVDLNETLGWEVRLKGTPKVGYSLGDFIED